MSIDSARASSRERQGGIEGSGPQVGMAFVAHATRAAALRRDARRNQSQCER